MHLLHQFMRLQRGDPFGRNGRQHADGDPVAPVECQVLFDQRLGSVQHHGKDLRAGLLGQREGPGLEAVDLTVLRARALGKNRHRSPARNPLFPVADQLFQRLGGVAAVDADVAVQQEELAEEGRFEDLALRHPAEISHHQINKRGSSYVPLSYSLYRNNINENITNKAVKELINQKPFSYLCSTNFMKMSERKIIHIDMDAFYASVEQRDNPELCGKPLAVGHAEERGVVAAASYEARRYGVHSAMSSQKAKRLCPELIFVPGRMNVYKAVSRQIHDIFHTYTDIIEPLSLDEAFLDVTENKAGFSLAIDIAKDIKKRIRKELGLIASAGVSYNKFLAKIASDYRKPDGLCTIHPDQALDFIAHLPIESFWGVGPVTAQKMHALGIHNGTQLQACTLEMLTRQFGKAGNLYYDFARGIDLRPVEPIRIRKSVGCEHTLEKDISLHSSAIIELYHVVTELLERLKRTNFSGNTLTLKIKFHDFNQITRSITQDSELTSMDKILPLAKKLLKEIDYESHPIRLIGLSVSNPKEEKEEIKKQWEQLSLEFKEWDD